MTDTTFVAYSNSTPITAAWLNDVNLTEYHLLGNAGTPPATVSDILANIGADAKYATLAGTNSFTGDSTFNNNTIYSIRNTQTAYSTAAFQAQSTSGDIHIGLYAAGTSATSIRHVRGTSGISVVESDGSTLASVSGAAAGSSSQLTQFSQVMGIGQTWQDVTGSRAFNGTNYTNTTGKAIEVSIGADYFSSSGYILVVVDGVVVSSQAVAAITYPVRVHAVVGNGSTYNFQYAGGLSGPHWYEYR
jgi:hypothetical protein